MLILLVLEMFTLQPSLIETDFPNPFKPVHYWLYLRYLSYDFARCSTELELFSSSEFLSSFSFGIVSQGYFIFFQQPQSKPCPFSKSLGVLFPKSAQQSLSIFGSRSVTQYIAWGTHVQPLCYGAHKSLHCIYLRLECFKGLVLAVHPLLRSRFFQRAHLELELVLSWRDGALNHACPFKKE